MLLAPLLLFVYNRPWHTCQTIEALRGNELAKESELFIFSDGPKDNSEVKKVDDVKKYVRQINGFKNITVIERRQNLGLAKSIITGVTEVVNKYGKVIVMEDDLISSPFFLKFMNEALEWYALKEKVISISGYTYPINTKNMKTFFIKGADCLGWATWKRGWDIFEEDGKKLLDELIARKLTREFNYNNTYNYIKMLNDQIHGKVDSWAIRWYASAFLKDRLTLYPRVSFIRHIGNDGSGTNFGKLKILDYKIVDSPITISNIPIEEDADMKKEIEDYLRSIKPSIVHRICNFLIKDEYNY